MIDEKILVDSLAEANELKPKLEPLSDEQIESMTREDMIYSLEEIEYNFNTLCELDNEDLRHLVKRENDLIIGPAIPEYGEPKSEDKEDNPWIELYDHFMDRIE